jgi:flagellin
MVQTAEGALNQVQTMLQRIRELAVEASNSTLGQSDAQSVNAEITALQAEITRTATSTTFNNLHLLNGDLSGTGNFVQDPASTAKLALVVGAHSAITNVSVTGATAGTTYTLSSVTGGAGTLTLKNMTTNVSQTININTDTVTTGPVSQVLNFGNMGVSLTVTSTATDTAAAMATTLDGKSVITGAASAWGAQFQIGANQGDTLGVSFGNAQDGALGGGAFSTAIGNFTIAANGGVSTDIAAKAGALIAATDLAINTVSQMNSNYGAVENRLNDTVATLSVTSENLQASESRIKDLNVAAEMVNFTKTQILQQAGTAILAQANSAPQNILTLLR